MSELRLPYYSTPSLCWYPKWPKFPHCIACSRPPPSLQDLDENITTKVLLNTRQATTVRKSFTILTVQYVFWCFRFEKWPLEREMIWRHEEKEMMWSRPPPTFLPSNQTTAPWWAVDQWRKQENRRKSELQIWFISEWIQVKKKYSGSCFKSSSSRYGIWRSIYVTKNYDHTPIATIASALYARTLIARNWKHASSKWSTCIPLAFLPAKEVLIQTSSYLCKVFKWIFTFKLLNYLNWDRCEGQCANKSNKNEKKNCATKSR